MVCTHHNVRFQAVDDLPDILLIVGAGAGVVGGDELLLCAKIRKNVII
jgi:hypothetical protein